MGIDQPFDLAEPERHLGRGARREPGGFPSPPPIIARTREPRFTFRETGFCRLAFGDLRIAPRERCRLIGDPGGVQGERVGSLIGAGERGFVQGSLGLRPGARAERSLAQGLEQLVALCSQMIELGAAGDRPPGFEFSQLRLGRRQSLGGRSILVGSTIPLALQHVEMLAEARDDLRRGQADADQPRQIGDRWREPCRLQTHLPGLALDGRIERVALGDLRMQTCEGLEIGPQGSGINEPSIALPDLEPRLLCPAVG